MTSYKVMFWFGEYGDEETADRVVYVDTEKRDKRDITALALKQLGTYPKSYQVLIERAENVETLHVVKIVNSQNADPDAWYHDRDGELFVVKHSKGRKRFITCHLLGNTDTTGYIREEFCMVVNTFKAEDDY